MSSSERKITRPEHWANDEGTLFQNPSSWGSFKDLNVWDFFKMRFFGNEWRDVVVPEKGDLDQILKIVESDFSASPQECIKTTWIGHASWLVQMPACGGKRGMNILLDPIFSQRCSPSQWFGPKRITPPACQISDLPTIDLVMISHNHYDHTDEQSIKEIIKVHKHAKFIVAKGNMPLLQGFGVKAEDLSEMDWWESQEVTPKRLEVATARVTAVPAQHATARGMRDRMQTLWLGYVIKSSPEGEAEGKEAGLYFTGDTGYRACTWEDQNEAKCCPVFKEIGQKLGPFDIALLPIGAYSPRSFMSSVHCAPEDSVLIFKDVKAKKALGMHWGTFLLTDEPIAEPVSRLKSSCERENIPVGDYDVCNLGETRFYRA